MLLEENRRLRAEIPDLESELAIAHGQRSAQQWDPRVTPTPARAFVA